MLKNSLHAHPSAQRQAIEHWPTDGDSVGPKCECLKHILTPAHAAINEDGRAAMYRVSDTRQDRNRGGDIVELPPAVVRHLDPRAAMLDGRHGELGRHDALQQDREARGFADELDIIPIQIALHRRHAIAAILSRKVSYRERRTEMIATVGLAVAWHNRVNCEHDGRVARGLGAPENLSGLAAVLGQINLKPLRAGTRLRDLL